MRKRKIIQVLIGLVLVAALVLTPMACKAPEAPPVEAPPVAPPVEAPPVVAPPVELPPAGWSLTLGEIPEIEDKTPLHVGLLAGGMPELIVWGLEAFTEQTGIPVTYEFISPTVMYPKVNVELLAGTGAYDIINPEGAFTNEWSPYLYSVQEMAERFEPGGYERVKIDLAGYHPTLLRMCTDKHERLLGIPFYIYMNMYYWRTDLFEDPGEMAAFKAKYGYDLAPAETYEQAYDISEFFTRKKGELLKGEVLDKNFYGQTLMAGRYEINDELQSAMQSKNAQWARPVRDAAGNITKFVITKKDMEALKECMEFYTSVLPFTPPGTLACYWKHTAESMAAGDVAHQLWQCCALWPWSWDVADIVPGARLGVKPIIGGRPFYGAFYFTVPKICHNLEGAYWLMRYLGSFECQQRCGEKGWSNPRMDVMLLPKYRDPAWERTILGDASLVVIEQWDNLTPYVDDWLYFNSVAGAKIYEELIIVLHDGALGHYTPMETVRNIVDMLLEWQGTFGEVPIEVEPELAEWLGM